MDVLFLSRLQFAVTVGFHYVFPPLSIGLGLILVIMEGMYIRTKDPLYHQITRFWVRIFGLIFALGVATGIVMEFEFGTNWAAYSRFVGDVFGSALAAEGVFAFFLESGFLALLLFGWNKVSPRMHFFSTVMVALGAHFSAIWIVVANSWQQTPAGYHIVESAGGMRAVITDFWGMVFNPSSAERLSHVIMGSWQAGAFFVLSVSAWYVLKGRHVDCARASARIALGLAVVASVLQLVTGHASAVGISESQPAKLAAFEGHFPAREPAPMYLMGWVDEEKETVRFGVKIPGMLSWLIHGDTKEPVVGLRSFPPDDRPPVNIVFQSYHGMIAIGVGLITLSWGGLFFWWRGTLFERRWLLKIFVISVLGPQIANQIGWIAAEVGRQPYTVYNLLRTSESVSSTVSSAEVIGSLILFTLIYLLLFALFIYLLNEKIQRGPVEGDLEVEGH
ncbi:MAG: cytochrome ubiquinol oxidase subunit I, partial [Fidelibacterota bacterium]